MFHISKIKFRPSSHSNDYSVIINHKTTREARKTRVKLAPLVKRKSKNEGGDWDYPELALIGSKLIFTVYTSSGLGVAPVVEAVEAYANDLKGEETVEGGYQEFDLTIPFPSKTTQATLKLIFPEKTFRLLQFLQKKCAVMAQQDKQGNETLTFHYAGAPIFTSETREVQIPHPKEVVNLQPGWKVNVIYDSQQRWRVERSRQIDTKSTTP
jgi:hypothetical protein